MALPEPVHLTVGDIRQRIFEVSADSSEGMGALAGQLFHRVMEAALADGHPAFWRASVAADLNAESWSLALYDLALGPELGRLQASLRDSGAEVLAVWNAVRAFARWFCGVLREAAAHQQLHYDATAERWCGAETLFRSELDLSAKMRENGWSGDVIVSGRADHLIRVAPDSWCVVEFKLGGGHPAADAAQACLYHELLGGNGTAALLHFNGDPEPAQILFNREDIRKERPALMNLIGAIAGVAGLDSVPPETGWPKTPREADIELGQRLIHTLSEFGADAKLLGEPLVGPAFVRYLLEPGRGVSASKIEKQGANLQMRLHLGNEPMIGRAAGYLVVDIQRPDREYVLFRSLIPKLQLEKRQEGQSRVLAGIDLSGKIHSVDLTKDAAHLLVGGVPGGGKSEWLRCAVASLLLNNTRDTLRLILIDPKKNAFADLAGSPYLWRPNALVDSPDGAVIPLLDDLITEMERRYTVFQRERVDDLARYILKTGEVLPRLICVVDEFADLLMSGNKKERGEIENRFIRIAQKGRAAGIHLILATQRPSRQVVSGILKANIPGKIALQVANQVESRVLLDQSGAEYLLGKGDLLLSAGGREIIRLQSPWLTDEDRQALFAGSKQVAASHQ